MSAKPPAKPQSRAEIIEEFGPLDAEVRLFKPKIARHEELRKQIAGWFDQSDAATSFTESSQRFTVIVSARSMKRLIAIKKLYRILGMEKFLSICSVTLEAIQKIAPTLPPDIISESRTGHRTVQVVSK